MIAVQMLSENLAYMLDAAVQLALFSLAAAGGCRLACSVIARADAAHRQAALLVTMGALLLAPAAIAIDRWIAADNAQVERRARDSAKVASEVLGTPQSDRIDAAYPIGANPQPLDSVQIATSPGPTFLTQAASSPAAHRIAQSQGSSSAGFGEERQPESVSLPRLRWAPSTGVHRTLWVLVAIWGVGTVVVARRRVGAWRRARQFVARHCQLADEGLAAVYRRA
ncbi:MAG: hypothetical protein KDA61_21850, partial [Planctomycetales bacterium]|nr:hypothetical protein [Planctomycetales bacterium]